MLNNLLQIASLSHGHLILDLNELYGRTCDPSSQHCSGDFNISNIRYFLQYIHDQHLYATPLLLGLERPYLHGHADPRLPGTQCRDDRNLA